MKKNQMLRLVAAICLVSTFCNCSDKLSRSEAEQQIRKANKYPSQEIKSFIIEDNNYGSADLSAAEFAKLQPEGVLTYTYTRPDWWGHGGAVATLTDKGKQYAVSGRYIESPGSRTIVIKVIAANLDFGEITGIVEYKEMNTAIVSYTYNRKNITPFGRLAFRMTEGPIDTKCTFIKQDDGWKIVNPKPGN